MITFKQQISVPEELVEAMAIEFGYKPLLTRQIEQIDYAEIDGEQIEQSRYFVTEEYENPQTSAEFIDNVAKQHTINLFKPFGNKLVEQAVAEAKEQAEAQIVEPIVNALSTEIIYQEE
jgi:hypothetical protein